MSFLDRPATTTALIAAINILLAAILIQNAVRDRERGRSARPVEVTDMPRSHVPVDAAEGHGRQDRMTLAALVCPDNPALGLDSPSCTGPEADKRREVVREEFTDARSAREAFDRIVTRLGESALTDQARSIRRTRTSDL